METSQQINNRFSKEDVQGALHALGILFALAFTSSLFYLLAMLSFYPDKFHNFEIRLNQLIEPMSNFFNWIAPYVFGIWSILMMIFAIYFISIIWRGRHHLSEIFQEGE